MRYHFIPPHCTSLAQPIDVGIAKPFKDRYRAKWVSWVFEIGVDNALRHKPTRQLMAKWVAECWEDISEEIVKNSWMKKGFAYFPPPPNPQA